MVKRKNEGTFYERILNYVRERDFLEEYHIEQLEEKSLFLDWVACQMVFQRPIKTKQLFIYGPPSSQKTLIVYMISKVIRTYFGSARRNDFAGVNSFYDLWVYDEFHEPTEESQMTGATSEGTAYSNTLLKVLDGVE